MKTKNNNSFIIMSVIIAVLVFLAFILVLNQIGNALHTNDVVITEASTETQETYDGYSLEDTMLLDSWEITPKSVEVTDKVKGLYNSYFSPESGSKYVVVNATIKNVGTDSDTFLSVVTPLTGVDAEIVYKDEYKFTSTNLLGHPNDLHMATLNPLSAKTGIIVFEVADEAAASLDELTLVFSTLTDSVSCALTKRQSNPSESAEMPSGENIHLEDAVKYLRQIAHSEHDTEQLVIDDIHYEILDENDTAYLIGFELNNRPGVLFDENDPSTWGADYAPAYIIEKGTVNILWRGDVQDYWNGMIDELLTNQ